MLFGDHGSFLASVRAYVTAHPDVAPHVTDFVSAGLQAALDQANRRAVDMETLVAVLATARYPKKNRDKLVADKLVEWQGRSAMNWTALIADLQAQARPAPADPAPEVGEGGGGS